MKPDTNALNEKVKARGYVDREHLTEFLTLLSTNDAQTIIKEVKAWLQFLHDSPEFAGVTFPKGDIDAVISDLDSYGRLQPETILQFKQTSNKVPPMVA